MTGGRSPVGELPAEAYAAALAGLPGMGPARLAAVLSRWNPADAWREVATGRGASVRPVADACRPDPSGVSAAWARAAATVDLGTLWASYAERGVTVHLHGRCGFPSPLDGDHEAPAVVFARGRPEALSARRVAIVGTRRCTRYGTDVAHQLGRELAAAGVAVVSGLALGVDGAAHTGALAATSPAVPGGGPVAVVGSGLDVVYPRRHARLWSEVGERGLLVSEAPLGARPEPWRFPVRNRIIAALAEVVVVVESHARGGSLHTVEAAMARDVPVMAVPGSVRSSASELPNALLADGCAPVRDTLDVLVALGLPPPSSSARVVDHRPPPTTGDAALLDALGWEAASLEELVTRTGLAPGPASLGLARLQRDGWVAPDGAWWERVAAR